MASSLSSPWSTIKSTAGSLFSSFKNMFGSASGTSGVASAYQPFATPTAKASNQTQFGGGSSGGYGVSGSWGGSSYTPQYGGQPSSASRAALSNPTSAYNTGAYSDGTAVRNYAQAGASYGNSYSSGNEVVPERMILQGASAKQYAKSAGLDNFNIDGMTYEEADQAINKMKSTQKAQVNPLTSAFYSPEAVTNTANKIKNFSLKVDDYSNNTWMSGMSKKENIDNLLQSTAKDVAEQFDSTEALAKAYFENPTVQKALDTFAQYGGSDDMLDQAIKSKQSKTPTGNVQSTMEYQASLANQQEQKQTEGMMNGDKVITDELARTAKLPQELANRYFGDAGIWDSKVSFAMEKLNSITKKTADKAADMRAQANLMIEKNNAELEVEENKIERNRINAKNYLSGMLAKLGALNTTSAAADSITVLDQRYEQQTMEMRQKVRFANQEIQIKLQQSINDLDSTANDKIQAIKEDLSKDKDTMIKEIMKEKNDADKRIYDLTLKASDRLKKNNDEYKKNAVTIAEEYTTQFNSLINQGFDPAQVAGAINVKLPAADQQISSSARIKDPNAISYFKSLPIEFKNQWIQFASTQPKDRYFTLEDIKMNYEPYVLEKSNVTKAKEQKKTNREI
jgi:hypothetical protein